MPGKPPFEDAPAGQTAEVYYELLPEPLRRPQPEACLLVIGQDGDGGEPMPGQGNGVIFDLTPEQADAYEKAFKKLADGCTAKELREALDKADPKHAPNAQQPGSAHGLMEADVQARTTPGAIRLADYLRDRMTEAAPLDFTYRRLDRGFQAHGLAMPALDAPDLPPMIFAVDTSGSISDQDLELFAGCLDLVWQTFSPRCAVLYHDTEVGRDERYEAGEAIGFHAIGRGGTSHADVLRACDAIAEEWGGRPLVVCLTDMESDLDEVDPPERCDVVFAGLGPYKSHVRDLAHWLDKGARYDVLALEE